MLDFSTPLNPKQMCQSSTDRCKGEERNIIVFLLLRTATRPYSYIEERPPTNKERNIKNLNNKCIHNT